MLGSVSSAAAGGLELRPRERPQPWVAFRRVPGRGARSLEHAAAELDSDGALNMMPDYVAPVLPRVQAGPASTRRAAAAALRGLVHAVPEARQRRAAMHQ